MILPAEIKKYINSFLCPICHCGLDGIPWSSVDGYAQLVLYCVSNQQHFLKELYWWSSKTPTEPRHIRDVIIIFAEGNRYTIEKRYDKTDNRIYGTRIYFLPTDPEGRVKEGIPGKEIYVEGDVISFDNFSLEECIDRINTIIMFQ